MAIPTGKHFSNCTAEVQTLKTASASIEIAGNGFRQVVFLICSLSSA